MTTISPNRKRTAARWQVFSIVLLACAIMGTVFLAREPLSSFLWRIGAPIAYASQTLFGQSFFAGFASNQSLAAENALLRRELASSSVLLLDRSLLLAENADLKARLNRTPAGFKTTLAAVLLQPPRTPYDTLVIDVGKSAGVALGDYVAAGGSVYIGKVSEVYASAARVTLFSNPGETYAALLVTSIATSTLAISVAGQGGGSLTSEVPANTPVHVGDKVIFPGSTIDFIAHVVGIEEKRASFKTIYMQLPVAPSSLRFVEVRHRQ
jgi:cell shape-determining protein MreC